MPNDEVAARFGDLLTDAQPQRRELMVRAMLGLSSAVAVASERKLEAVAAVDARAPERFELAMLYLLEAAMAKGTIRPLDGEFARLIARGERNWR